MPTSTDPQRTSATAAALVTAATDLVAANGTAGARMVLVAQACGVSVGTVYNHFASKEHLLDAVAERLEQRFVDAMQTAAPPSAPLRDRLPALADALVELGTRPQVARLLRELSARPGAATGRDGALVRAWIAGRVEQMTGSGPPPAASAVLAADLGYALVAAGLPHANMDPAALARTLHDALAAILQP